MDVEHFHDRERHGVIDRHAVRTGERSKGGRRFRQKRERGFQRAAVHHDRAGQVDRRVARFIAHCDHAENEQLACVADAEAFALPLVEDELVVGVEGPW